MLGQQIDLWSEEDVKNKIVIPFFTRRDFDVSDISFESPITVFIARKKKTLYSDIVVKIRGEPALLIETKNPRETLDEKDKEQAISYARLNPDIIPFAVITNGKDTKVYDVMSKEEVSDLHSLDWIKGRKASLSMTQELRYEALRSLISLNYENLLIFCEGQKEVGMKNVKGNIVTEKYDPQVYVERTGLLDYFNEFVDSDKTCFAIIGAAGSGKTCALCRIADEYGKDNPTLFYQAYYLGTGLEEAIRNDFVWAFKRDEPVAILIDRLDQIVRDHEKKLVILLDAINEFPQKERLKVELANFATRIKNTRIKLCITCREEDWNYFVRYRGEYTPLVDNLYTKTDFSEELQNPVGFYLSYYSEPELSTAWIKYRDSFRLKGGLYGETRNVCKTPFMLRLVAEIYKNMKDSIPGSIRHEEILSKYWKTKLGATDNSNIAGDILLTISQAMLVDRTAEIPEYKIRDKIAAGDRYLRAYEALQSEKILEARLDNAGEKWIKFYYDFFMEYVTARFLFTRELADSDRKQILLKVESFCRDIEKYEPMLGILLFYASFHEDSSDIIRTMISQTDYATVLTKLAPQEFARLDTNLMQEIQKKLSEESDMKIAGKILSRISRGGCEIAEGLIVGLIPWLEQKRARQILGIYSKIYYAGCSEVANRHILPILRSQLEKQTLVETGNIVRKVASCAGIVVCEQLMENIKPRVEAESDIKAVGTFLNRIRWSSKNLARKLLFSIDTDIWKQKIDTEINLLRKAQFLHRVSCISADVAHKLDPDASIRTAYYKSRLEMIDPSVMKAIIAILEEEPVGLRISQIGKRIRIDYLDLRLVLQRLIEEKIVQKGEKLYRLSKYCLSKQNHA